jgi:hypothetical protein
MIMNELAALRRHQPPVNHLRSGACYEETHCGPCGFCENGSAVVVVVVVVASRVIGYCEGICRWVLWTQQLSVRIEVQSLSQWLGGVAVWSSSCPRQGPLLHLLGPVYPETQSMQQ